MRYEILDAEGGVTNTIIADRAFVDAAYPGRYRALAEPVQDTTRAELAALDAQTGMSRLLREQFAALPTATQELKDIEAKAQQLRGKLK